MRGGGPAHDAAAERRQEESLRPRRPHILGVLVGRSEQGAELLLRHEPVAVELTAEVPGDYVPPRYAIFRVHKGAKGVLHVTDEDKPDVYKPVTKSDVRQAWPFSKSERPGRRRRRAGSLYRRRHHGRTPVPAGLAAPRPGPAYAGSSVGGHGKAMWSRCSGHPRTSGRLCPSPCSGSTEEDDPFRLKTNGWSSHLPLTGPDQSSVIVTMFSSV